MTSTGQGSGVSHKAHNINRKRTQDVCIEESVDFTGLCLSQNVLGGLKTAGFVRPSPIQLKAIPLGRCGLDLIVQAKSGTGKTCVFTVIALENLILKSKGLQVLVLAPTREIAMQISEVIKSIGARMSGLSCHVFIGGMPVAEDKQKLLRCQVAVGTPGRVKQLIEENVMNVESVRLFILDEADKLLEDNFQEQINWIFSSLPDNKQMLALSATYPEYLAQHLQAYMRNPTFVRLNVSDPALFGIRQYYQEVKFHPLAQVQFDEKVKHLTKLLSHVNFQQCLVFSNYQMRAESLADVLISKGWPAAYISGSQDQQDRISAMDQLKTMQCRILISTDLTSRGIDVEHVNLVVNLDLPWDHETYLHRIGRAGRFGSYGAAVSFTAAGKEYDSLMAIANKCNTNVKKLPDPPPEDLAKSSGFTDLDSLVTVEKVITQAGQSQEQTGSEKVARHATVHQDHMNGHKEDGESDREDLGIVNIKIGPVDLPLQDEQSVDSVGSTPTTFMEDMEKYSICQEIGPEENSTPDWSGALQDVYSLVKEIKDLYVSEKSMVDKGPGKHSDARKETKERIPFDDAVKDYDDYVSNHKDGDFEKWLEKMVPKNDIGYEYVSEIEVKMLIQDVREQSERLLRAVDMADDIDDDIIDEECELNGRVSPFEPHYNSEDEEEVLSPEEFDKFATEVKSDVVPKKQKNNYGSSHSNKVRMGVGSMLNHLLDDEMQPKKDAAAKKAIKNGKKPKNSHNEAESVQCCASQEARPPGRASPVAYEDGVHDISLPEVVDFSEYDQSYLYFEKLDTDKGAADEKLNFDEQYDKSYHENHHHNNYEVQDYYYGSYGDVQYYEEHASDHRLDGQEYGEQMAERGTDDAVDDYENPGQRDHVFKWVQDDHSDGDKSRSKHKNHKEKKGEKRDKSYRSNSNRHRDDNDLSDCHSAHSNHSYHSSASCTSSRRSRRKHSDEDSAYANSHPFTHPSYPSYDPKSYPSWAYPGYQYPGYQYPSYPCIPAFFNMEESQYYASVADAHLQWAKYYQKLSQASRHKDSLFRHYKMQDTYIKHMMRHYKK